jgi:hypothetical protein
VRRCPHSSVRRLSTMAGVAPTQFGEFCTPIAQSLHR